MEYDSATKKNEFQSVLVRMKKEAVKQSEVSQKEKKKYCILTHILYMYSRKIVLINLFNFSSVQSLSRIHLFVTSWIAGRQAFLSITNSWSHSNSCP